MNEIVPRLAGRVPEWLKGADCKSAGVRLRWFESNPFHQFRLRRIGTEMPGVDLPARLFMRWYENGNRGSASGRLRWGQIGQLATELEILKPALLIEQDHQAFQQNLPG